MTILLYLGFISQQSERIFEKILFFSSPFCNLNALYNVTENICKKGVQIMNDEMKKAAKLWIQDELKEIEQNETKAEWKPSLKFRLKMKWIFWKAKMKEQFFR